MRVKLLYEISKLILIFSIVVSLIGVLSGGALFDAMSKSPIGSYNSSGVEDVRNNSVVEYSELTTKNGTLTSKNGSVFEVSYGNSSEKINTGIHGLTVVSESNIGSFNGTSECKHAVMDKYNSYYDESLDGQTVRLFVVDETNNTVSSSIVLYPENSLVAGELIERGFAKAAGENPVDTLTELQQEAKRQKKGIWAC
jgi:hypothetical protein